MPNYTIISIDPWIDKNTGVIVKDRNNNHRYNLSVKDADNQIISFNKGYKEYRKDDGTTYVKPHNVGDTITGSFYDEGGKTKFKAEDNRPAPAAERAYSGPRHSGSEVDKYPSFALSYAKDIAVAYLSTSPAVLDDPEKYILDTANRFHEWLVSKSTHPSPPAPTQPPSPQPKQEVIPLPPEPEEVDVSDIPF